MKTLLDQRRLTQISLNLMTIMFIVIFLTELAAYLNDEVSSSFPGDLLKSRVTALGVLSILMPAIAYLSWRDRTSLLGITVFSMALALPFVFSPLVFEHGFPQGFWLPFVLALSLASLRWAILTFFFSLALMLVAYPTPFANLTTLLIFLILFFLLVLGRLIHDRSLQEAREAQKQVEQSGKTLQESQDKLLSYFENAPNAVFVADARGHFIEVNPAGCKLLGYSPEEMLSMVVGDLAPSESLAEHLALFSGIKQNKTSHFELALLGKDGSHIPVSLDTTMLQNGNIIAFATNATQRIRSEEALKHHLMEVEDLYQNAPCGYHSINHSGVVVRINDTELDWLGYAREEVIGRKLTDFLSPATVDPFTKHLNKITNSAAPSQVEVEFILVDGSFFPVQIEATSIRDHAGKFVRSRAVVHDLRKLKKIEHDRNQLASRQVAAQEELRRRLAADLHDRTSPNLAAIAINLRLIAKKPESGSLAEHTALIDDTRGLIDDTAANIREISAELRPALLDYAGLLSAMENYSQQFSKRSSVEVRINSSNGKMRLSANLESVMFRIFQEALTNCAKHASARIIRVSLEQHPDCVALTIVDDGIGLPQPADTAPATTGLGLLSMRETAERAGGTFSIESSLGRGTRLQVKIDTNKLLTGVTGSAA